ncbi:hypothetical protein SteCoe_5745 [Stentor coeruleus]|uniref:RGS domain-containing protein n=1 Tax=Stentor coeruleus TaxID=5963 RepID=A0A1R2CRS6_9CILI|nr:hypothetical protein SteCoe_5745 [Stentor coeruleus]
MWGGFSENIIVIIVLTNYLEHNETSYFGFVSVSCAHFTVHYLYFIPFLLKSYRMHLIFKLDKDWNEQDFAFKKKMMRTKEKYLLKILIIISIPVISIAICSIVIGGNIDYIISNPMNSNHSDIYKQISYAIAMLFIFLEQFFCILSVYALRNINDDFYIKKELILVCLAWIITSPNNTFGIYSFYAYQILLRNTIVFVICSIFPLCKSFKVQPKEIPVTEDILNYFPLLLSCEITLNAFEQFLKTSTLQINGSDGSSYLNIWLRCEYHKKYPQDLSVSSFTKEEIQNLPTIQRSSFSILETTFFPLFKESPQYNYCLKEVNIQNLYLNRLQSISLDELYYFH